MKKASAWQHQNTPQFKEIIYMLESCKKQGTTAMIIGSTGIGKTYAIDKFCNQNQKHTYRITISSLYKLVDIVNELTEKIGIDAPQINTMQVKSFKYRMDKIVAELIAINENGGFPIIIFDEAENMEMAVLKMLKALYDALKDHCAIVLIGTEQLDNKMLNLTKRNRDGIPQLYRRFKAGRRELKKIKPADYSRFFEAHNIADKNLQLLLAQLCTNYGELHDYLEPVLREAKQRGKQVDENIFRLFHNLPINTAA